MEISIVTSLQTITPVTPGDHEDLEKDKLTCNTTDKPGNSCLGNFCGCKAMQWTDKRTGIPCIKRSLENTSVTLVEL